MQYTSPPYTHTHIHPPTPHMPQLPHPLCALQLALLLSTPHQHLWQHLCDGILRKLLGNRSCAFQANYGEIMTPDRRFPPMMTTAGRQGFLADYRGLRRQKGRAGASRGPEVQLGVKLSVGKKCSGFSWHFFADAKAKLFSWQSSSDWTQPWSTRWRRSKRRRKDVSFVRRLSQQRRSWHFTWTTHIIATLTRLWIEKGGTGQSNAWPGEQLAGLNKKDQVIFSALGSTGGSRWGERSWRPWWTMRTGTQTTRRSRRRTRRRSGKGMGYNEHWTAVVFQMIQHQ